jgi:hypothetical protein
MVPQISQCFGCVGTMSLRPSIYFFLDFGDVFGAHSSHSIGRPINHLLWPGFNWPPFSIPAEEPVSISPEAVSRAASVSVVPE